MYTTLIIVVLAVIAVIFAGYKINKEAKADDIEKEISRVEKKNHKSNSGSKGIITTCDFCGEKFNTLSNSSCPSCGGKFYKEESSVIKNYTAGYSPEKNYTSEPKQTASKKSESPLTPLFKTYESKKEKSSSPKIPPIIVVFAIISILIVVIAYFFESIDITDYDDPYSYETEDLFDDEYDIDYAANEIPKEYTEADYGIPGNNIIFDNGEIRILATGFYIKDVSDIYEDTISNYEENTLLQYYIENYSDSDVNIQFKFSTADGNDSFVEFKLSGNESYSGYSFVQPPEITQVEKLVVSYISIYDGDNEEYIYSSNDDEEFEPVIITTDLYSEAE